MLEFPTELNNILTKCNKNRGEYPLGINYDPKRGYKACLSRNSEKVYLGYYSSIEDAFDVYRNAKEVFIKQQAEKWRCQIDPRAYEALMNYQVEITD